MDIIFLVFVALLFVWFIINSFTLFYYRYLRTYKPEIKDHLASKGYKYIETVDPRKQDWVGSPFEKPSFLETGFSFIFFPGRARWTKYEYLIAIGEKNQKYQQFWLELKTSYFQKPKLVFRDGKKINYTPLSDSETFQENCPSCGFMLFNNNEKKCPNCGSEFITNSFRISEKKLR